MIVNEFLDGGDVVRECLNPVDPPEVFDRLKTEAKEDALKIKQFLQPNLKGAPIWEMGKRVEQGKNATWDIIAKWAAKSQDAGYQGRGGYMTPFEIFIDYLQMQTFTVSEWGVDQWTNSFELIFDRMSDSRVAQFKTWIKNLGGGSKHDKPFGMVHFDVGKVLKEAGEVYVELGGAFLTGGASIVAKIADWLINKLPKLLAEAKSVYSFVQKIRDLKFDDVKKFYRERDGRIRLQPANETMAPMYIHENDISIQGIVVGVLRRY